MVTFEVGNIIFLLYIYLINLAIKALVILAVLVAKTGKKVK